jgi:CRP-like cAMP-binding protein
VRSAQCRQSEGSAGVAAPDAQVMAGLVLTRPENRLLASLAPPDFELLHPHIKRRLLAPKAMLYDRGAPITEIYFPHGGAISLVIAICGGEMIEAGLAGRDGILGAFAALGGGPASHRAVVQIGCSASAIDIEPLRQAAKECEAIRSLLLRHEQTLLAEAQQLAACNAAHPLEARLCRWLLRARDACGKSTLAITQETIADLLGVTRTTISSAAHSLQSAGLLSTHHGYIDLLDVAAIQHAACECHGSVAKQYNALLAPSNGPSSH